MPWSCLSFFGTGVSSVQRPTAVKDKRNGDTGHQAVKGNTTSFTSYDITRPTVSSVVFKDVKVVKRREEDLEPDPTTI